MITPFIVDTSSLPKETSLFKNRHRVMLGIEFISALSPQTIFPVVADGTSGRLSASWVHTYRGISYLCLVSPPLYSAVPSDLQDLYLPDVTPADLFTPDAWPRPLSGYQSAFLGLLSATTQPGELEATTHALGGLLLMGGGFATHSTAIV